MITICY